jgi:hypothetical protein
MGGDEQTDPSLTEPDVVVILEQVLEEYEKSHPEEQSPPVSVDVDVDEGGKGDVTVNVEVDQPRP